MMTDLDQALAQAKLPEATVPVCLRGDLQADFEDLERHLDVAQRNVSDSLAGNTEAIDLAKQIESLRGQMEEFTVHIRVKALPRPEWLALVAKHPPRDDNDTDAAFGFATDELWPPLVRVSITPKPSDETWAKLDASLTAGQMEALGMASAGLNRSGKVSVPKSRRASDVLRKADATPR